MLFCESGFTCKLAICGQSLSHARFSVTPWTAACQALLSMGFSRQEYWSGLSFPPPGDLPNPGTEPVSPASSTLAAGFSTTVPPACNVTHCPLSRVSNNKHLLECVPWFSNGINPPFHTAFCNCLSPMEYSQASG